MNKILVIVGPTSSGKSEFAVKLAKLFKGEIISCDSRQIYKGMGLGTGKVKGRWKKMKSSITHGRALSMTFVYKGVSHHLIDFVNPKRRYSAALFQNNAKKVIVDVLARGKLPILCGGTAQWIDAVIYNRLIPDVKPNLKFRMKLEKKSVDDLFKQLKKFDSVRAENIDKFNKRRLIRAIEIVTATGKPVLSLQHATYNLPAFDALWLGINPPQAELFAKIKKRLKKRLDAGMAKEVLRLRRQGLSWKKLESFGLEYKFVALYLQKKISYDEMFNRLLLAIKHYSKRQMTWWKRNTEIRWLNELSIAQKLTSNFLAQQT